MLNETKNPPSRLPWILPFLLLAAGGLAFAAFLLRHNAPSSEEVDFALERLPASVKAEIPTVRFTDVTGDAGIQFVHRNGASAEKLLPETMGGGVVLADLTGDSHPDLLFVDGREWPWNSPEDVAPSLAFYVNDGRGHFTERTAEAGLDATFYGMGAAIGDFDNDGAMDFFVTAVGINHLFRNLGDGKFAEVTDEAGVGGADDAWSTSCAFLDYNNDGLLDLFVCNYVQWSRDLDLHGPYVLPGIGRAYGQPMSFNGAFPYLYRNDGNGRFTDVSKAAGMHILNPATGLPLAKSLGVAPVDVNNDGWIDIVVANDTVQNFVFVNQQNGTFEEQGARAGIAFDSYGQTRGAMGIDAARFRNDSALGIAMGNFANEMNALYVRQPDSLLFADEATTAGVGPASRALLKFGLFFFDYDLNGRLDVLTANGHLEPQIADAFPSQRYRQPAQLFWNRGGSKKPLFVPVPAEKAGKDLFQPIVGRGSAYGDIDGDGDLDVVLAQIGGPPLLLRNDLPSGRRWLRLKLEGTRSNRAAIGTWVRIFAGGEVFAQQVMPARGYLSQSESILTFGLGNLQGIDGIAIEWAGGTAQRLGPLPLDRLHQIRQPE